MKNKKKLKIIKPTTYDQALKKASTSIWPGCGDGRKRGCGAIHDFSYNAYFGGSLTHRFLCTENYFHGCPNPKSEYIN